MRFHRFIGDYDLSREQLIVNDAALAQQLFRVLRLKKGDTVILCDGSGQEATAEISSVREKSVAFNIADPREVTTEPARDLSLYCSILKRENFEFVAQKATELGVRTVVPLLSARTVKCDVNPKRVATIMREAAEQSGRGRIPDLHQPMYFEDALGEVRGYDANIFFDMSGDQHYSLSQASRRVAAFIGPEGGWDQKELESARRADCMITSFGPCVLRAETAAIVGVFTLLS